MKTNTNQRIKAIRKATEMFNVLKKKLTEKGKRDIYIEEALRCFADIEKDILDEKYTGCPPRFRSQQKSLFDE